MTMDPTSPSGNEQLFRALRAAHPNAAIAAVSAQMSSDGHLAIRIETARPGILIGKRAATIEGIRDGFAERLAAEWSHLGAEDLRLQIVEVAHPELQPVLVADDVLRNVQRGVAVPSTLERHVRNALRKGAVGIRITLSGGICAAVEEGDLTRSDGAEVSGVSDGVHTLCRVEISGPAS